MSALRLQPSSESWLQAAIADLPTLLIDHAHCEKKAAHTAVRWLFTYPEWPTLLTHMSRLAREELVHFEQVLRELKTRQVPFRRLQSASYAAQLFDACRPDSTVDRMLACALIEARSHERFERLAAGVPDQRLRIFYADLCEAEARHGSVYLELAEEAERGPVDERLAELAAHEAQVIARPAQPLRMHAGG
jgi:tRNA-(ms[2]io[6]A)-hydroxylase